MKHTLTKRLGRALAMAAGLALAGCDNKAGDVHVGQESLPVEQIAGQVAPKTIDPALWRRLTAELDRVLAAYGTAKRVNSPATGKGSAPGGFWLASDGGAGADATWTYRNQGDYDLNGEVNISDLTQIGLAFGRSSTQPNWEDVQHVDGDGNGEINIADVTPMGQNYGGKVAGYTLESSPPGDGPWTSLAWLPYVPPAPGDYDFPAFTSNIPLPAPATYYRVSPTENTTEPYTKGTPSPALLWSDVDDIGWNQQAGGPQHLNQSSKTGPADKTLAWEYALQGVTAVFFLLGSPVSDHWGTSYVCTYQMEESSSSLIETTGYVFAVDRFGELVYGKAFPTGFITQPLVLPNQTVVVNDLLGKIWCLSRDGQILWTQQIAGANGDNVSTNNMTCTSTGNIYATDEAPAIHKVAPDGHIVWTTPLPARAITPTCVVDATRVCVGVEGDGVNNPRIYYFMTLDGAPAGFIDTTNETRRNIVYQPGEFLHYLASNDELRAVPVGIMAPWTYANPDLQTTASVTWSSDRVVGIGVGSQFALMTGTVVGLDDFGAEIWSRPLSAGVMTEPLIDVNDRIYVSTLGAVDSCGIYAIDENTHDIDWFYPEPGYNSGLCMAAEGLITYVSTTEPIGNPPSFENAQFKLVGIGTP